MRHVRLQCIIFFRVDGYVLWRDAKPTASFFFRVLGVTVFEYDFSVFFSAEVAHVLEQRQQRHRIPLLWSMWYGLSSSKK